MSTNQFDFQRQVGLAVNFGRAVGRQTPGQIVGWLTPLQTALAGDTTTHDRTIQAPPAALNPTAPGISMAEIKARIAINYCKAGGATSANMATWLGAMITALGGEAVGHDIRIVQPASSLLDPGKQHS